MMARALLRGVYEFKCSISLSENRVVMEFTQRNFLSFVCLQIHHRTARRYRFRRDKCVTTYQITTQLMMRFAQLNLRYLSRVIPIMINLAALCFLLPRQTKELRAGLSASSSDQRSCAGARATAFGSTFERALRERYIDHGEWVRVYDMHSTCTAERSVLPLKTRSYIFGSARSS